MSSGYYVTKDNTAKRWDWLNTLTCALPYSVFAVEPDAILGRRYVHSASTLKNAKRIIEKDQAGENTVWRERDGREVLPDLREEAMNCAAECRKDCPICSDI